MVLALILLLVVVYLLGEQWGRESPSRTKQAQDIVSKKAELKNLETGLTSSTTSAFFHLLILVGVILLILFLFGGSWNDFGELHRSSHRYR